MDASLGFPRERFSKSIENDIHSRIVYRNDVIARLVRVISMILGRSKLDKY